MRVGCSDDVTTRHANVSGWSAKQIRGPFEKARHGGRLLVGRRARLIEHAFGARPTGVGRALATYEIPIEGRDEWLAAARRLA